MFTNFLDSLDRHERAVVSDMVELISKQVPDAVEGTSYGMPSFKLKGRPLIGFGKNKFGLSLYPFDPRVIRDASQELENFEHSKGAIRFTVNNPLPADTVRLLVDLRLGYLGQH